MLNITELRSQQIDERKKVIREATEKGLEWIIPKLDLLTNQDLMLYDIDIKMDIEKELPIIIGFFRYHFEKLQIEVFNNSVIIGGINHIKYGQNFFITINGKINLNLLPKVDYTEDHTADLNEISNWDINPNLKGSINYKRDTIKYLTHRIMD